MRVAACVVVVLAGCGRVGFVDAGIAVEQTDTTVRLTVPERFRLVFDSRFEWQPIRWYDLASDPDRDLIDKAPVDTSRNLLQGLLVQWATKWQIAGQGTNATIAIDRVGSDRVQLTTAWTWVTATRQFAASIVHTIGSDGTWRLDASIADPSGDPTPIESIEYADSHLTPDLTWEVTGVPDSYEFVAAGVTPSPSILVTRDGGVGTLSSDELNNRYWAVGSLALPVTLAWTVTLGQR